MCGRYATTRSAADLSALFEASDITGGGLPVRYNLAPTDPAPVIRQRERVHRPPAGVAKRSPRSSGNLEARVLALGRWGLLPHWAKDPKQGARMINARAETVATARGFRDSFATRRALVPADGWYEWRRDPAGSRQAYFLTPRDGSVLALAGLWSKWGPEGLLTFSVVTTAAVGPLATVHDRMPLVLPGPVWREWLSGEPPHELLRPPAPDLVAGLEIRPVSPAVGNVRNDGPELVRRVDTLPVSQPHQPTLF